MIITLDKDPREVKTQLDSALRTPGRRTVIIYGPRQSGKTYQCIEWFLGDPINRMIVTPSEARAKHLRVETLRRLNLPKDDPYIYVNIPPETFPQADRLYGDPASWRIPAWRVLMRNVTGYQQIEFNHGRARMDVMIDQADDILHDLLRGHALAGVTWSG